MKIPKTRILGIRVDLVDMQTTLDYVEDFIKKRTVNQIVVVNVAKVIRARANKFLRSIIEKADLAGADGIPLVWISKFFCYLIPGRVNGTDLMDKLITLSAKKGYSIYFLGAKEQVINKVVNIYKQKYPSLKIAGFRNGYFSEDEEEKVADEIKKSNADILLVGISTPKKEYFIYNYKNKMEVPVIHGVGGSFDVVAGVTKRAPKWMQNYGLEWLFRLIQEPGRMWKRYLVTNTKFILFILLELLDFKKFR